MAVDDDLGFTSDDPIKSACENGRFAHWSVYSSSDHVSKILSLDMKNEVFHTVKLANHFGAFTLMVNWCIFMIRDVKEANGVGIM